MKERKKGNKERNKERKEKSTEDKNEVRRMAGKYSRLHIPCQ